MELSLETCRLVVKHVDNRTDLCSLCRVNKSFQQTAEQALYNTIYTSDARDTFMLCSLFARTPRLAMMVEDLTLFVSDEDGNDNIPQPRVRLPNGFWRTLSEALRQSKRLRFLNLHIDNADDAAQAWVLNGATFRLHSFHCDLQWDNHLVAFLNTQTDLDDLYIADFSFSDTPAQASTSSVLTLDSGALPNLSTLECTFIEAACSLVPARPVSRLKTCFSKTQLAEKRKEKSFLFSKLMETTHPLRSLDIADSSYSDTFSMELFDSVVRLQNQTQGLRYLGTLVLPVQSRTRLEFYGLLRRLSSLECIEVDVSEWDPQPQIPAGMRALAGELRLYCPSLLRIIFVNDFERTVISASHGTYALDLDCSTETMWKEF